MKKTTISIEMDALDPRIVANLKHVDELYDHPAGRVAHLMICLAHASVMAGVEHGELSAGLAAIMPTVARAQADLIHGGAMGHA